MEKKQSEDAASCQEWDGLFFKSTWCCKDFFKCLFCGSFALEKEDMVKQLKHIFQTVCIDDIAVLFIFSEKDSCQASNFYKSTLLPLGERVFFSANGIHPSSNNLFFWQDDSFPAFYLNTFLKLQHPTWAHKPFPHINEHSRGSIPCQEDRSPWVEKGGCSCAERKNRFQWMLLKTKA